MNAEVLDELGRSVMTLAHEQLQGVGPHTLSIPTQGLSAGLYTVRVVSNGVAVYRRLVVAQ